MYTYNKNDNSYTFSFDDLDIDDLINPEQDNDSNETLDEIDSSNTQKKPKKIEVINGGNDLDISPVSDYLEIEKPRNEKKENIVIPENN